MSSSSDHSTLSMANSQPLSGQPSSSKGTQKVKYQANGDWDFYLDATVNPVDLSLILPHYRARCEPVNHRMSMFVVNERQPVKLKVCRNFPRSKFYLEVVADTSDVTVYLPSDFKGSIHVFGSKSTKLSSGFINRILKNARLRSTSSRASSTGQDSILDDCDDAEVALDGDEVSVETSGKVTFKMWDIRTCDVESSGKETLKRLFGCTRKAPENLIDWDCLLKD